MSNQFNPPSFGQPASNQGGFNQPPPRKSPGTSVGVILGIVAGVVLFAILLLGGIGFFAYRALWVDSSELVVQASTDGLTTLTVPKNWAPLTGAEASPVATIQTGNRFAETYAMVISEPKLDFAAEIPINPNPDGTFSLEDYSALVIGAMTTPEIGLTSTGKTNVTINGMPGVRYNLEGVIGGVNVRYLATLLDGKDHFHQVHGWTLRSREESNVPKLLTVVESFQEQ